MQAWELEKGLYVEFAKDEGRPVRAVRRPPRKGTRHLVPTEPEALSSEEVYLVYRRGSRPVALGARASRASAEVMLARLGGMSADWEIARVPVVGER
jgi:hypothetical protein